jgi:hypothetical protein
MDDTIRLGRFTVIFDDEGATFTSSIPKARYRINAATATNAIDFMKHHRGLCIAMSNGLTEELAAYKVVEASN